MTVRETNLNDLVQLEKCSQFPLERLSNKLVIWQKSFEDDEGLIGSALVSCTLELDLILNGRSKRDKIRVLKQLLEVLPKELRVRGYRDGYVFTPDSKYADLLVKHFGFIKSDDGVIALRKEF